MLRVFIEACKVTANRLFMATIKDVAQEAGVSVATVSRHINKKGILRPETAKRVEEAAAKLAYNPNLLARNLRKNESRVILIISPNVTNPYYALIITGIGDTFNALGYSAVLFNTNEDPEREAEALKMLSRRRADGAILMANYCGNINLGKYMHEFPIVQCSEYDPALDLPHVSIDNYSASAEVMAYLIELGHQRIAMISSENNYISTQLRAEAYRNVLKEKQIESPEAFFVKASRDYSFKSGKNRAKELLNLDPRPTAIFCISDTLAMGAIIAAHEMGLRVPEDLSVVGFDDVEHTTMLHPFITTVAQPCYDLGKASANLLYQKLNHTDDTPKEVILEHKLIIRESTGTLLNVGLPHRDQMAQVVN